MRYSGIISRKLSLLNQTFYFLRKHLMVVFGLALIAAFGRVMQLGGFGPVTSQGNIVLEIVVESSRILLFLYVLGLASCKRGVFRVKQVIFNKKSRDHYSRVAMHTFRTRWKEMLRNFFVFGGIAWFVNYLIDLLAYHTCLYLALRKGEILSSTASEWTIILFFKNISVIPFTLTFEALFLLWIINKYQDYKSGLLTKENLISRNYEGI